MNLKMYKKRLPLKYYLKCFLLKIMSFLKRGDYAVFYKTNCLAELFRIGVVMH